MKVMDKRGSSNPLSIFSDKKRKNKNKNGSTGHAGKEISYYTLKKIFRLEANMVVVLIVDVYSRKRIYRVTFLCYNLQF